MGSSRVPLPSSVVDEHKAALEWLHKRNEIRAIKAGYTSREEYLDDLLWSHSRCNYILLKYQECVANNDPSAFECKSYQYAIDQCTARQIAREKAK